MLSTSISALNTAKTLLCSQSSVAFPLAFEKKSFFLFLLHAGSLKIFFLPPTIFCLPPTIFEKADGGHEPPSKGICASMKAAWPNDGLLEKSIRRPPPFVCWKQRSFPTSRGVKGNNARAESRESGKTNAVGTSQCLLCRGSFERRRPDSFADPGSDAD